MPKVDTQTDTQKDSTSGRKRSDVTTKKTQQKKRQRLLFCNMTRNSSEPNMNKQKSKLHLTDNAYNTRHNRHVTHNNSNRSRHNSDLPTAYSTQPATLWKSWQISNSTLPRLLYNADVSRSCSNIWYRRRKRNQPRRRRRSNRCDHMIKLHSNCNPI